MTYAVFVAIPDLWKLLDGMSVIDPFLMEPLLVTSVSACVPGISFYFVCQLFIVNRYKLKSPELPISLLSPTNTLFLIS